MNMIFQDNGDEWIMSEEEGTEILDLWLKK